MDVIGPLSVVTLIFGGCCSNVFTLEKILEQSSDSGLIITFAQFILAALLAAPTQLAPPSTGKTNGKPAVPTRQWSWIAAMFFAVNMLNNWAFAFKISVPVHIILRSFGSVMTMVAGYIRGKTYTRLQVFSVGLLTVGVLVSAWADAESKGKNLSASSKTDTASFVSGLSILLVAQALSAYMGVFVQDIYANHTTSWQENLFFSHALSLPLFLPLAPTLQREYAGLANTKPLSTTAFDPAPLQAQLPDSLGTLVRYASASPAGLAFLFANAATQVACISGVNLLAAKASAVTVTIVLNVRKLVSFVLSTWLFGHALGTKMAFGAALVFGSGALYGFETSGRIPRAKARAEDSNGKKKAS